MKYCTTEHLLRTGRHTTFYLSCGPQEGPLLIFVHGWPELSNSWRHQLPYFGNLGFRAVAPDMRGYGRSGVYHLHADYALEHSVDDMLELLQSLGRESAIWVGHDWGSPVVWGLASHYPQRCRGVANLCVPYLSRGFAPQNLIPLVDRTLYPQDRYPAGQWEYMLFYEENFQAALSTFEANIADTVKALFRSGNPKPKTRLNRTALVRADHGWFGGTGHAPEVAADPSVLNEEDLQKYVAALTRNGFFGPDSWYMNAERNVSYAAASQAGGKLTLPVLFLHGAFDYTCETMTSDLAQPMRADCADLTEIVVQSGHWMAQEQPTAVNSALSHWLATHLG